MNLPNGEMTRGCLLSVDFDYNIAVIGLGPFPAFKEASLDPPVEDADYIHVTAICCNNKGNITPLPGVRTMKSTKLYGQKLIMSTCIIPEVQC